LHEQRAYFPHPEDPKVHAASPSSSIPQARRRLHGVLALLAEQKNRH